MHSKSLESKAQGVGPLKLHWTMVCKRHERGEMGTRRTGRTRGGEPALGQQRGNEKGDQHKRGPRGLAAAWMQEEPGEEGIRGHSDCGHHRAGARQV